MKNLYLFIHVIFYLALFSFFTSHVEAADTKDKTPAPVTYAQEMYSGWYTDTEGQGYGYIGAGLDRIMSDHWALSAKLFTSYMYYKYDSGSDTIKAKVPGVKLLIGTKHFYKGTYFIISGGIDYRNTSLSPDDESSSVRGSKTGAILEAIYSKDISERLVIDLMGNYGTIGDSLWGRGRLKYLFSGDGVNQKVFIGIEGTGEGNSDYSAYRVGPIVELQIIKQGFSVLLAGGYKHTNSISSSGYLGIELYYRF
ncbi:MAG: cellulose biosynthesis protein BcsS [Actinobacteria bacterium]|nr:cellulose biosynthesis protein BcsS [Actinomycetota bacterium]